MKHMKRFVCMLLVLAMLCTVLTGAMAVGAAVTSVCFRTMSRYMSGR